MARINIAHGTAKPAGLGPNEPWLDDATGILYVGGRPVTGSNRNLLVNGDFAVNQRGQSRYTEALHTVDMWYAENLVVVDVVAEGVRITNTDSVAHVYRQVPEAEFEVGQTLCFSAQIKEVSEGVDLLIQNATTYAVVSREPIAAPGLSKVVGVINEAGYHRFSFRLEPGASALIQRAKLELGPISTLALDGPADYGAELARCQRYYVNYPDRIYLPGASNNTGTFFYALVNLPTTMRIAPTVTSGNGIQLDVGGTRPEANIAYTGIVYATTSQLTLKYTPTTAIPVNQAGVILVESMALSAEL